MTAVDDQYGPYPANETCASLGTCSAAAALASAVFAASPITVRVSDKIRYQTYDGTGISEAFQRSLVLHLLDSPTQNAALDLLFTDKGAGMTILRNGLGSSPTDPFDLMKSICPVAPGSNSSEASLETHSYSGMRHKSADMLKS